MKKVVIMYVKAGLRRMWGRSKQRQAALKSARISRGMYKCAACGDVVRRKQVNIDHRIPVGRFSNFDLFIERLFVEPSGLDCLCISCHKKKSKKDKKKKLT